MSLKYFAQLAGAQPVDDLNDFKFTAAEVAQATEALIEERRQRRLNEISTRIVDMTVIAESMLNDPLVHAQTKEKITNALAHGKDTSNYLPLIKLIQAYPVSQLNVYAPEFYEMNGQPQ